ncbi:hypothetical protein ABMA28_003303 [Loxostege sticticalis]|uniref:Uncharacterized protein n=1 Tax=Loxostege sticticalis TaxID=481309 RepID=A0ABD0SVV3_LOXSC
MSEEAMLHIITCTSSAEIVHIIQQSFFQYKFERGMSVFLSKIQELQNQLKQMGEEISDKFVITKVLMSLPDEYKHFISAWESAPDDKQTFDNLVARLLIVEERIKEKNEGAQQATPSAFWNVSNNKNCFYCGNEYKSTRTCELIHVDTCGPMEEPSVGGSRYFVVLKDDYSNFRSVYFVKKKDRIKYTYN